VENVRSLVRSDRRLTLRMISSELNLNRFTVHQILTQGLGKRKVCAKMVPKNLMPEQKANQRDVCLDLLDRLERVPESFSRVITDDESWILEYDPGTKRQSREWHTANSPRHKKARMSKSKIKSMIICFFFRVRGSSKRILCHQDKLSIKILSGSPRKTREKGGTCANRYCTHLDAAP